MRIFNKARRNIAAKACFFVFTLKMLMSATPIFVDSLNKGTVLQIVMQLEVEQSAKAGCNYEDLHGNKAFKLDAIDHFIFNPTIENDGKTHHYLKNEKSICSYHPSVPTPPPNC